MPQAMTFDVWFTLLVPSDDDRAERLRASRISGILRGARFDVGAQAVRDQLLAARDETFRLQRSEGIDLSPADQVRYALSRIDIGGRVSEGLFRTLLLAYETTLFDVEPFLMPGAVEALRRASSRVKCGLICNTGATPGWVVRNILHRKGVDRFLDCMVFSDEVGVAKPNRSIFDMALSLLGTSPRNAVHVGDDPLFDVQGGLGAGMSVVWFNSRRLDHLSLPPEAREAGDARGGGETQGAGSRPAAVLGTVSDLSELPGVMNW